jgi:hypothetical protein
VADGARVARVVGVEQQVTGSQGVQADVPAGVVLLA